MVAAFFLHLHKAEEGVEPELNNMTTNRKAVQFIFKWFHTRLLIRIFLYVNIYRMTQFQQRMLSTARAGWVMLYIFAQPIRMYASFAMTLK